MQTKTFCKWGVPYIIFLGQIPVCKWGVPVCKRGFPVCILGCLFLEGIIAKWITHKWVANPQILVFAFANLCELTHSRAWLLYSHEWYCPFASISAYSSIGRCAMYVATFKDTTIFVLCNTQQYCNCHHITRFCIPIPDIAIPKCNWGLHLSLSSPFVNGDRFLEQVMSTMPSRVPSKASSDNIPPQDDNHG